MTIIDYIERFAQDLRVHSKKLPKDFYLEIGLEKELLEQYKNQMKEKHGSEYSYDHNIGHIEVTDIDK